MAKGDGRTRHVEHQHETERSVDRFEMLDGLFDAVFVNDKIASLELSDRAALFVDDADVQLHQRRLSADDVLDVLRPRSDCACEYKNRQKQGDS